jgi:hypothetical protein
MASRYVCTSKEIVHLPDIAVKPFIYRGLAMAAPAPLAPRFIRRTYLSEGEYNTNFRMLDCDCIGMVTSKEADRVTPLMSKIYLRLVNAPQERWEQDRVLYFGGEMKEGKWIKAWDQLCELLGVASATASKALRWMHEQGVMGYCAGKNGVGIRIFLNRAASSVVKRTPEAAAQRVEKILRFPPASFSEARASLSEAAFKDNFVDLDDSENLFNSRAPKNGAAETERDDKTASDPAPANTRPDIPLQGREVEAAKQSQADPIRVDALIKQILSEAEPKLCAAAAQAARREHERTREWLETRGLPKAARVAQHEAYNVLKNYGLINETAKRARADLEVGRSHQTVEARPLNAEEIKEVALMCLAMFETHGQAVDVTLSEISSEAGGFLLAEDAPRVRAMAESMIQKINRKEK